MHLFSMVQGGRKIHIHRRRIMYDDDVVYLDADIIDQLSLWHSGQGSAVYSLLSTGQGTTDTIERASVELSRSLVHVEDEDDREELEELIDRLDYIAEYKNDI